VLASQAADPAGMKVKVKESLHATSQLLMVSCVKPSLMPGGSSKWRTSLVSNAVDGRNDAFGNLLPETSLKRFIMAQPSDFQDEETLMQRHGRSMGVKVDQTPKGIPKWQAKHPKVAGEDVDRSWAGAKDFCHCLPLSETISKQNFERWCQDVLMQNVCSPQQGSGSSAAGTLENAWLHVTQSTIMKMIMVIGMRKRMVGK
jgi:hypothetical protein